MLKLIEKFAGQWKDAYKIGENFNPPFSYKNIEKIIVTGLGGSAIGGDLLRVCVAKALKIPLLVNRYYLLPSWVNNETLVFLVSYSGNTEETISAYKDALKKRAKVICLTSGGELARLAKKDKMPCIIIPEGYPPRAALGYLFLPGLVSLMKLKLIPSGYYKKAILETEKHLKTLIKNYSRFKSFPKKLASLLKYKPVLVCGSQDNTDAVALRWKTQINENSKSLGFTAILPEMNHNEVVGWSDVIKNDLKKWEVIFLRDKDDHPRIKLRFEITKKILKKYTTPIEIYSSGKSHLTRMFSLIIFGDFLSVYLANQHKIDPTPVEIINFLKNELSNQ